MTGDVVNLRDYRLKKIFDQHMKSVAGTELGWTLVLITREGFERKERLLTLTPPPVFYVPRRVRPKCWGPSTEPPSASFAGERYEFWRRAIDTKNLIAIYEEM